MPSGIRKTHNDFVNEVEKIYGNEYTVLTTYKNSNTKIRLRHNCVDCNNYEWETEPRSFLSGNKCPRCCGNGKYTDEEFKNKIFDLVKNEYAVLEEYKGSTTKILMKHNSEECNFHVWYVTPNSFLKGNRCPRCFKDERKTQKAFEEEIYNLCNDEYTIISEYKNTNTKIKFKHNNSICNYYEFDMTPNAFLSRGHRCPKCKGINNGLRNRKTHEAFLNEVYNIVGDDYIVLGQYKNNATSIKIKHNCDLCNNHIFDITPNAFIRGNRCPKCRPFKISTALRKTNEEFLKEIYDIVKDEYTVLSEYELNNKKVTMRHNNKNCDFYEWEVTPNSFISGGCRCPICNESKGEQKIRHWLEENNVNFESQYIFNDLVGLSGKPLRFDFAIFKDSEKMQLRYLIEYDGEFHFQAIKMFNEDTIESAEHRLEIQKEYDILKNKYCESNNIKLIRIPFHDYENICDILKNINKN